MVLWGLNGFFQSMAWAPGAKLINNWWDEHERGKAFGFYTMAAGLSSAVTYLISIILLQQGIEWRMLFRLPVLLLLVSATIFLIVAKDKPEAKTDQQRMQNKLIGSTAIKKPSGTGSFCLPRWPLVLKVWPVTDLFSGFRYIFWAKTGKITRGISG
ncbi:sn-glycerol-3-phosphate transporter [compost metagenome]